MKKYAVTSDNFIGELYATYDADGVLCALELQAQVPPKSRVGLIRGLALYEADFLQMPKQFPTMRITEIPMDLSFESFWKLYNYKHGKKEAEAAWHRTNQANKTLAINAIAKYDKWLQKSGTPKLYAATYLNKERYTDEYK